MLVLRKAVLVAAALVLGTAGIAEAQTTHGMIGDLFMGNPSAGATRAKDLPDSTVVETVMSQGTPVASPTPSQGPGLTLTIPVNQWRLSGVNNRTFMDFPSVAQNTEVFTTTHAAETFVPNGGPGNFSFCPQITGCLDFSGATLAGAEGYIQYVAGPNVFGGAFRLMRSITGGAWFVANPGPVVAKTLNFSANVRNDPWSAGIDGASIAGIGEQVVDVNPGFTSYTDGRLGPNGSVTDSGNNQGFNSGFDPPDGVATGFPMTTGTINMSDSTPAPLFTASSNGYDQRDNAGNGNIQLVGGSVAYGGFTGNVFFRTARLSLKVPEPGALAGLAAGLMGLVGLARLRRQA